jgi:hypothetical protein
MEPLGMLEIEESVGVLHVLREELTPEQAADLFEQVRPLLYRPSIVGLELRGAVDWSSPSVAALVGFLAFAAERSGKAFSIVDGTPTLA